MHDYDVAISFAGEDRAFVNGLAEALHTNHGLRVFYDDYEQAKLLGEVLTEYLIDIYKNKARYCVLIVSKHYKEKRWTQHEWRAAQARAFEQPELSYLLPIRLDSTELLGLLPTIGYLSAEGRTIGQLAEIVFSKVSSGIEQIRRVRLALEQYAAGRYESALKLLEDPIFNEDVEALRIRADAFGQLNKYREAIDALKTIVAKQPEDFMSHMLLGIFYFRVHDFANAVLSYERADLIAPGHPTVLSDLPIARRRLRRQRFWVLRWLHSITGRRQ